MESMINNSEQKSKKRFYYLDNLKVLLTILVIAHHTAQAYSSTAGEWVYKNTNGSAEWLGNFMAVNASFFMGLFFMISGYFIPQSFKGKKTSTFIATKAKRLMIPVLFILIVIVPIYFFLASNHYAENKVNFIDYYFNTYWGKGVISYEHGWYMVNLFMYSLVYVLVRLLLKNKQIKLFQTIKVRNILLLAVLVGILSTLIRYIYPINTWIDLLGVIGMEPAHLPQYALFFIFGIIAYHNNYFEKLSKKTGYILLSIGTLMALVIYLSDLNCMKNIIASVWDTWAFYESFMAVFISLGLIILFREYLNISNKLLNMITASAFGAYVVHNLFVVTLQLTFDKVAISASFKFLFISILSVFASFLVSYLALRFNYVKSEKIKKIRYRLKSNA